MATAALKAVGVEAVVEGLAKFVSDIGTMNKSMSSLGGSGNIVTRALEGVGSVLGWLGDKIVDVATYALGALLARAIEFVVQKLGELISATIEAAAQFQVMELRLDRLNFNSVIDSVGDYTAAMNLAQQMTQEQLDWVQQLAVTTPFDAADVANVFTLARSYGFAADEAQVLTRDISDFAAGMGLGNTEIERIIVNFGQMVQQGKVTQREMNDLARGAFVPVNDVLKIMQEETGLTGDAFDDFRNRAEGVELFFKSFSQLVETRFAGATQQMARTFSGATANAQDFVKSLFGLNVVTPVLDVVGGKIADLLDEITQPGVWEALNLSARRMGEAFAGIFDELLGGVDVGDFTSRLLQGMNRITGWVNENKDNILGFFRGIGETITERVIPFITDRLIPAFQQFVDFVARMAPQVAAFFGTLGDIIASKIIPFITQKLIPAFQTISDWVTENGGLIQDFFFALAHIFGDALGGVGTGGIEGILDVVEGFMTFVIENNEAIGDWVELLTKAFLVMSALGAIFTFVGGVIATVIGFFISIGAAVAAFLVTVLAVVNVALPLLIAGLALILTPIGLAIVFFLLFRDTITEVFNTVVTAVQNWLPVVGAGFEYTGQVISDWATNAGQAVADWAAGVVDTIQAWQENFGQAFTDAVNHALEVLKKSINSFIQAGADIVKGLAQGVKNGASALIDAIVSVVKQAIAAALGALESHSPSRVFMRIGESTMQGMAKGILGGAKLAENAMLAAVSVASAPALNLLAITQQVAVAASPMVSTSNNYTNNYNLTVNSQARTEPIIQDYNMLKSMAGA